MPQFKYKSIDSAGKIRQGTVQSTNALEIEHRLSSQGQELIVCQEVEYRAYRWGRKKLERRDLINFVLQLEQLTKAGVPLLDSLHDLRDSAPPSYYRDVLAGIVEGIEGGKTFSEAIAAFPGDFDSVFVNLIAVGEESGELPRILKDMGETMKWSDELISATVKILIYPTIVAVVIFSVTAFLMIYLVPKIIPFIQEMGGEIPLHTLALIATSNFFVDFWYLIVGTPVLASMAVKYFATRSDKFRYKFHKFKLALPLVGAISFKIKIARMANYMALLYASGITVLRSLDICKGLVNNDVIAAAIDDVKQHIIEGRGISDSFQSAQLFPPLVIRMVKVGENTGNLDEALLNVSYFYNREVQEAVDKIEPAISPVLTVTMGLLLGWIMLSVLGPVWDAIGKVG